MNNLPIRLKIGLGFSLIIIFILTVGYVGNDEMSSLSNKSRVLLTEYAEELHALSTVDTAVTNSMIQASVFLLHPTKDVNAKTLQYATKAKEATNGLNSMLKKYPDFADLRSNVNSINSQIDKYTQIVTNLQNTIFEINTLWTKFDKETELMLTSFLELNEKFRADVASGYQVIGNVSPQSIEVILRACATISKAVWPQDGIIDTNNLKSAFQLVLDAQKDLNVMKESLLNPATLNLINGACATSIAAAEKTMNELLAKNKVRDDLNQDRVDNFEVFNATISKTLKDLETVILKSKTGASESLAFYKKMVIANIILALIIAFVMSYIISAPIKKCVDYAVALASGHQPPALNIKGRDEIAQLANSLEAIPQSLETIITANDELFHAISTGEVETKADTSRVPGRFQEILQTTNEICDRFLEVIEAVPSAVVILNAQEKICYINQAGREVTGNDYHGKTCGQVMAREDYGTERCGLHNAVSTLKPAGGETIAHPQGRAINVKYYAVPILDKKTHQLTAVLQLIIDTTEAKRIEETIRLVARESTEVAQRVASAASQLSVQIGQAENGSTSVSARIEEAATAMEEMNNTVVEVAHSASNASSVANDARNKADDGAKVVEAVVHSIGNVERQSTQLKQDMVQLGQQAESIGTIMNVISDIADQTNLLALNAAIEAARAGEAGRGFAVVADEVRKLAEKTMQATAEVGSAIRNVQTSVEQNMQNVDTSVGNIAQVTEQARQAGTSLEEIVSLVEASADQIRAIATAAEEQSVTSDEISRTLSTVTATSSETSIGMQEASMAVNELAEQASRMNGLISQLQSA